MRLKRYSIKIATLISVLALSAGCSVNETGILDPLPSPAPDQPSGPGEGTDPMLPKRPIPLKPKKNPGGKIERPKLIDDIIGKIFTTNGVIRYSEFAGDMEE